MVLQSRGPPFWAPLLACLSLSQPSCSEAVVVTIIFSCSLNKRSLKWNLVHFGYFLTKCSVRCSLNIYFLVTHPLEVMSVAKIFDSDIDFTSQSVLLEAFIFSPKIQQLERAGVAGCSCNSARMKCLHDWRTSSCRRSPR